MSTPQKGHGSPCLFFIHPVSIQRQDKESWHIPRRCRPYEQQADCSRGGLHRVLQESEDWLGEFFLDTLSPED